MKGARWLVVLVPAVLALLGCNGPHRAPEQPSLSPSSAVRVGPWTISRAMLELWSDPEPPLVESLVRDTLLGLESDARQPGRAAVIERAALDRALRRDLAHRVMQDAPPSEQEKAQVLQQNWLRFDRPRAVRTVVVRVPVPELADDTPYFELAQRLRDSAEGAHNIESLLAQLSGVQSPLEVQRVRMPPVAQDGRVVPMLAFDHDIERVEPQFAERAVALQVPGDMSPVFALHEAFQFLFATEIVPATSADERPSPEQMERLVAAERVAPQIEALAKRGRSRVTWSNKDVRALLGLVGQR